MARVSAVREYHTVRKEDEATCGWNYKYEISFHTIILVLRLVIRIVFVSYNQGLWWKQDKRMVGRHAGYKCTGYTQFQRDQIWVVTRFRFLIWVCELGFVCDDWKRIRRVPCRIIKFARTRFLNHKHTKKMTAEGKLSLPHKDRAEH